MDGAFKRTKAGIGVVIREDVEDLITTMATLVPQIFEPLHLETIAIFKGG